MFLINSPLHLCFTERMEKEKLETDAMFKLDHEGKDKEKLKKALPSLTDIIDYQSRWKDDYQLNSSLRRKFRVEHSYFTGCSGKYPKYQLWCLQSYIIISGFGINGIFSFQRFSLYFCH